MKSFYEHIFQLSKDPSLHGKNKEAIEALLEKARTKKGLKKMEVARALRLSPDSAEISKIFGDNNKNVGKTFAGVRLYTSVSMMLIVQYGIKLEYDKN